MRGTYAVLALGAVLASGTLVALNQDPADAACANKGDPGCQTRVRNVQQLAQVGKDQHPEEHRPEDHRPETHRPDDHHPEEHRPEEHHPDEHRPDEAGARDHGPPPEGRDVVLPERPAHMLDELSNRITNVVHNLTEVEGREREAERKMREADDDMENARAHREAAEADKRAAAEDRERQVARFVALLEQALHDFKFVPGPRSDEHSDAAAALIAQEHREPERRSPRPHEAVRHSHQMW
jgi:hypothetical protein